METRRSARPGDYVVITHDLYGCDSGCCGHTATLYDRDGNELDTSGFEFSHPGYEEDHKTWATSWANELWPGADLNWDECEVTDD